MNKIKYFVIALIAVIAAGCVQDKVFEEITSVPLKRCLEPMNLSARVDANTGVTTTFRWDATSDAEEYLLEVLAANDNSVVLAKTVGSKELPVVLDLEADGEYTFRVTAKAAKLQDSKVAAYDDTFKTYAIKDNLFMVVTGRGTDAVSLEWSAEAADYLDVTHIDAVPTSGGQTVTKNLSDAEAAAAAATVSGLQSSTEYDIVLFFKSASRGAATVWTSPAAGTATKVSTTEALLAAMTAGDDVYVAAAGSPYAVGSVTPAKGFRMLGETAADGSKPVVQGDIVLNAGYTGDLYIENIKFDGTGRSRIIDHKGGALAIDKISMVNCEVTGYACGIYYDNVADQMDLGEFLMEGCEIYDIAGSGGDGFDVRNASAITKITLRNNTIRDAFRSFLRYDDKSTSLGELVFENNTVKASALPDKGLLYIRCPWSKLTIRKNLFLHQTGEKAVLATTNLPENVPTDIVAADNYCFNIGEKFFGETKNFTAAQVAATVLTEDPCFNSKGNFFNLANADLQSKKVGAAKWWNAYVEPVEDLTQGFTEAPHNWNLGDATLFAGDLTKSKVRDGLLMVASEEHPMNLDGALTFKTAAPKNKKGVPTDGYAAFKVTGPGSVVIEVADSEGAGSQIVIATGDVDGGEATVKGGAVDNGSAQKVVLADISGEAMVYLYPSGPISITTLAWSPDMTGVNTALAAPVVTISTNQVNEGDETAIDVAWDAVSSAASYEVTFNKKKTTVEECAFTIDAETVAALEPGSYTISVVAKPADTDIYNTASEAASTAFAVLPVGGGDEPVEVERTLTWDFSSEEWQAELAAKGTKNADITNWVSTVDGLTWTSTAKSKWNTATINEATYYFIQAGGKGSASDRTFTFTAPANGTLTILASNTGGSAATDTRRPAVIDASGETQLGATPAPASTEPMEYVFDVAAGTVTIYPDTNGLRFYKITFVYKEIIGGDEPVKEDYVWDFSSEAWQAELAAKGAKNADITNWVSTLDGLTWTSTAKSKWNTATINEVNYYFIQAGGKGSASDRIFTFTVQNAGTVTILASNTGGSAATDTRRPAVIDASGETQLGETPAPASTEPKEYVFEVAAGQVTIYPDTNGLRFYKIEFHSK